MKFKCDYPACSNKPHAEIYAKHGWTYLCKKHFIRERPHFMNKEGVWGYWLVGRDGNWITPSRWAMKQKLKGKPWKFIKEPDLRTS